MNFYVLFKNCVSKFQKALTGYIFSFWTNHNHLYFKETTKSKLVIYTLPFTIFTKNRKVEYKWGN